MSRGIMQFTDRSDWEEQRKNRQRGKVLITAVPFDPGKQQRDDANEQGVPGNRMQSNETIPELLMAVLLKQDRLTAVQTFSLSRKSRIGAIYLGKVKKLVKNLNACFVEIADREQCFLSLDRITDPPFLTNRAYDGRILEGDELLVQLEYDAIKTKQAVVTTRISLRGEYFVLSTGEMRVGISKKLGDKQRKEIRGLLTEWQVTTPNGVPVQQEGIPPFGLVVRTQAGQLLRQASEEDQEETEKATAAAEFLHREYEELYSRFSALFRQGRHRTCFTCLQEAGSALEEALRPFPTGEYEEVVTDLAGIHDELKLLQEQNAFPEDKKLRFYQDERLSLNQLYSLSARLEEALGRTVWMKSGANLVIEQTESLTAIDVNTGKSIAGLSRKSAEETICRVNLEAAREVARQLRLRNLSGIIIVDFINMASSDQKEELMAYLRELVREDPVTVRVVDMTPLGLVEITRKKVSPSLLEQFGRRRAQGGQ